MSRATRAARDPSLALARATTRAAMKIQQAFRRHRARRRGLDARVGGGAVEDAVSMVMRSESERVVRCGMLTIAWFAMSTGLALFNKETMGAKRGGFPAPLLLTATQFAMQYVFARVLIGSGFIEGEERRRGGREEVPSGTFWRALAPVGAAMGLDIALSNLSLVFITVSTYTVVKTSTIVFTLGLAFLFRFERPTWYLGAVVGAVVVGQVMSAEASNAQFNSVGFYICLASALMSALRWILSQRVMHRDKDEPGDHARGIKESYLVDHPVVFVYLVMPVMCGVVFTFSCLKERWWVTIPASPWFANSIDIFADFVIFTVWAMVAFCLTLAEFALLNETSALTIMMIGVLKDILAIVLGILIFGDKFGVGNVGGLILCILGVIGYNKYKLDVMKRKALANATRRGYDDDGDDGDGDGGGDGDDVPLVNIVAGGLERRPRESHHTASSDLTVHS